MTANPEISESSTSSSRHDTQPVNQSGSAEAEVKSERVIGLFAKYWEPGRVKTRLASSLGNEVATEVYIRFLNHLLQRFKDAFEQRWIVYSPSEQRSSFEDLCRDLQEPASNQKTESASARSDTWQLTPQVDSDLGQRMKSFFEQQFEAADRKAKRSRRIIVIGSDSPQLTETAIEEAFEQLKSHDVVIGPSTDGGYYLIGMRDRCHEIFHDIKWSDPTVYAETIARLAECRASYFVLPTLTDVDELDDLKSLQQLMTDRAGVKPLDRLDQQLLEHVNSVLDVSTWSTTSKDPSSSSSAGFES